MHKLFHSVIKDPSAWLLVISNIVAAYLAFINSASLYGFLWLYWFQSVFIGIFNFLYILLLKEFSTKGFSSGGKPVPVTRAAKITTAFFFLIHYNGFHLAYAIFLFIGTDSLTKTISVIYPAIVVLFLNHLISFFYNRIQNASKKPNLGQVMFSPYIRIVPMHLFILVGGIFINSSIGIIVFILIKTLIDVILHAVKHLSRGDFHNRPTIKYLYK